MLDPIISKYIENPTFNFLLISFFLSFLIGFVGLTWRFLVIDKGKSIWVRLNAIDKIGLSTLIGLLSFVISLVAFIIFFILTNIIGVDLQIFNDETFNIATFIAISFCYPFFVSKTSTKNIKGFNYITELFSRENMLFFIFIAITVPMITFSFRYGQPLLFFIGAGVFILGLISVIIKKKYFQ